MEASRLSSRSGGMRFFVTIALYFYLYASITKYQAPSKPRISHPLTVALHDLLTETLRLGYSIRKTRPLLQPLGISVQMRKRRSLWMLRESNFQILKAGSSYNVCNAEGIIDQKLRISALGKPICERLKANINFSSVSPSTVNCVSLLHASLQKMTTRERHRFHPLPLGLVWRRARRRFCQDSLEGAGAYPGIRT